MCASAMPLESGLKLKIPPPCSVPSAAAAKMVENEKDSTSTMPSNHTEDIDIPTGTSKASKVTGKRKKSIQKPRAPKKVPAA